MSDGRNLDFLLKQMAEDHHPELPSPGLIWWRAQILRKQREKERIEQPLIIMRRFAAMVCASASILLVAANWNEFHATLAGAYPWLLPFGILAGAICIVSMVALLWSPASKA